ncbi:hypothetical protein KEJ44_04980 [Candidatus Bathyarchaeota archaeon]|nr:hypothetical protein [Candidatus Bathyarchaeota archaeon]
MNGKILASAIIGGVIITLLTGLFPNTPARLVGATHFGYPFAWLIRMVVAPQYFPWRVNPMNLIADIIVWAIIVSVIVSATSMARR